MDHEAEYEMDDWTFEKEAMIYVNRWDKTLKISAEKLSRASRPSKELNSRLNAIALSIQKKRKRERNR